MKKAYFLIVLFLYGLSVGNLFASASAAAAPVTGCLGRELVKAAAYSDKAKVERLIAVGADLNATDRYGFTALIFAAIHGNADIVDLLIKKGAEVNAVNQYGHTALMWAAENGHENVVGLLLSKGADKTIKDQFGRTAEILARGVGYEDLADMIRDYVRGRRIKSAGKR